MFQSTVEKPENQTQIQKKPLGFVGLDARGQNCTGREATSLPST